MLKNAGNQSSTGARGLEPTSLAHLLPDPTSGEPAIIAEDGSVAISHLALADQIERLASRLCGAGLRTGEAVALVLPNGVDQLVLCLALARAGLVAAPLNPSYSPDEIGGFIGDVEARAVVTRAGASEIADAAAALGAPVWTSSVQPSGEVLIAEIAGAARGAPPAPQAQDVALFLHTSGTEERPKVVSLTHANVTLSAQHIAAHYALTPADRSLVVLPLFHGHGLIGAALSTLASGGAVIVPERFSASRFWRSFRQHRATWYTAVPTIHQILLERADADASPRSGPRFIRSCSAALAPAVLEKLEGRFGAPVIEAYGLTEASHQVASNPLAPRKPGTVGLAAGVEIAVVDHGHHLPARSVGEVVVRGPTVMRGYLNNPQADSAAFVDGWLRTGDLGDLDAEGYLTLTGRIKELINRGGEKISPAEVEAVLMANPAVAHAAVFGVPDPKYGEEVEAAVVLKRNADPKGLRSFVRDRLSDFQAPKVIRIVPELPTNAMGKVDRRAVAALYATAV